MRTKEKSNFTAACRHPELIYLWLIIGGNISKMWETADTRGIITPENYHAAHNYATRRLTFKTASILTLFRAKPRERSEPATGLGSRDLRET